MISLDVHEKPLASPPAIVQPAPRQASFGQVVAQLPPGTRFAILYVDGKPKDSVIVTGARTTFAVQLPLRDATLRVVTVDAAGRRQRSRAVGPVFGLPRAAAPRRTGSIEDATLARRIRALVRGYGSAAGIYVQNLRTGVGASWNARARFPAASALKLAIAVETLRTLAGPPASGSSVDAQMRAMLLYSDNAAANSLETLIGGSTSGGSAQINAMLRRIGLFDTDMYGGYLVEREARPIPTGIESQPAIGTTKHSTAWDLARLIRAVYLAVGGRGPLLTHLDGFTPAEARYLLFLLLHVADHGKLDRFLGPRGGRRAQGRVDLGRTGRQRHRVLARRCVRGHGDDVLGLRRRHERRHPRRSHRAGVARSVQGAQRALSASSSHEGDAYHAGMIAALEITLAVGVVWVGLSYWLVSSRRLGRRALRIGATVLAALAVFTAVLLVVGLATDRWEWRELAVVAAGFVAAALAELGALALGDGMRRQQATDDREASLVATLDETIDAHARRRARELEQTLERERAETIHLLDEQERRLREERHRDLEEQIEAARTALTHSVADAQARLEQRLTAWTGDLERAQQQLKVRLEELIRRQAEALREHEQRLAEHAQELSALEEYQGASVSRLRSEVDKIVEESLESAKAEIEIHAVERRRALHEVGERLRTRERAMREQIEREEAELKLQFSSSSAEIERRFLDQLTRGIDRSVVRLSEDAERQFDRQLREARDRTGERLSRELELSLEHFMKAAENEVVNRIAEAAQASASRFQRQIDDLVRAAEVQTSISNERILALGERLEKSLAQADERLNAFEAQLEVELEAKLGEIERTLRAAGQSADRSPTRS